MVSWEKMLNEWFRRLDPAHSSVQRQDSMSLRAPALKSEDCLV